MPYTVKFLESAKKDYLYWKNHNPEIAKKIKELAKALKHDPFKGIGKPKPLKGNLSGMWSRRITEKDRILYEVVGNEVVINRCRGHYK
jgi:toxin YoeB